MSQSWSLKYQTPDVHHVTAFPGKWMAVSVYSSSPNSISDFGIPLVQLISKLLSVCIVFGDANEINLQLEWTVSFVSQSKSNGVYLLIQKDGLNKLRSTKKKKHIQGAWFLFFDISAMWTKAVCDITLSSQTGCWSSCILPRCVRKNLEKGICK